MVSDALSRASGNLGRGRDGLEQACTSDAPATAAAVPAFQGDKVIQNWRRSCRFLQEPSSQGRLREAGFELEGGLFFPTQRGVRAALTLVLRSLGRAMRSRRQVMRARRKPC